MSRQVGSLRLDKLVPFLDKHLALAEFPKDESINGLQVEGRQQIKRLAIAVDACEYVFKKAVELRVDFLFVHHGLIWGGIKAVTGVMRNRIKVLFDSGISLYACHLPLDWHPMLGNNVRIIDILGLKKSGEFGEYHGRRIGYWGRTAKEIPLAEFVSIVDQRLRCRSQAIDFGRKVRNIGVVSGGGWSALYDAERNNIDTFLTGEPSHTAYTLAEELRVNLIFSGHYATETTGVMAVGKMLEKKFGIETIFIDHPTGL